MKKSKLLSCLLVFAIFASIFAGTISAEAATSGDYSYTVNADGKTCTITKYSGSGGDIAIPGSLDQYTVTSIGVSAFGGCWQLTGVTIPDSVTSIGARAFRDCKALVSVTIPYSVESIGAYAFQYCSSLSSVTIPNSIISIENSTFEACSSLSSVTIPKFVKYIKPCAFAECSMLTSVYFDGQMPQIYSTVFDGTPLTGYYYKLMSGSWYNSETFKNLLPLMPMWPLLREVTVSSPITNGIIAPSTDIGMPGETVSMNIIPVTGYRLIPGSLKYNDGSSDHIINGISFTMPNNNITISGAFEKYTVPTVRLASPSGTGVPVSASDIVLSFDETVTGAANKTVSIFNWKNTYTYTIGANDNNISGAGSACKATIPISSFLNGTESLSMENATPYIVSVEAGAYISNGTGKVSAAGNIGCFMTELSLSNPPGNVPVDEAAADKVEADKAVLEIGFAEGDDAGEVTQNLSLTVIGAVYDSSIAWESSNTAVISNSGVVTRPAFSSGDSSVTVTASVYNNGVTDTKSFVDLKVLKLKQPIYIVIFRD